MYVYAYKSSSLDVTFKSFVCLFTSTTYSYDDRFNSIFIWEQREDLNKEQHFKRINNAIRRKVVCITIDLNLSCYSTLNITFICVCVYNKEKRREDIISHFYDISCICEKINEELHCVSIRWRVSRRDVYTMNTRHLFGW